MNIKEIKREPYAPCGEVGKELATEGFVLIKNNDVLPYKKGETVSVFGRDQLNYYKSGTGSGGLVNTDKILNIPDAIIKDNDLNLNEELLEIYINWVKENPYDYGSGWASELWCQKQMPLSEELVKTASGKTENALVIIGRLAGESCDNAAEMGSYYLTQDEEKMLETVSKYFKKVCILLNTGNIIDCKFIEKYNIASVMYIWQGGQHGAEAVCDVITGRCSPSGKLTDTIAKDITDYPSFDGFGDENRVVYKEDIYVGYRYFETFAKDKVLYPFGFGLSYTSFEVDFSAKTTEDSIIVTANVKNIGKTSGKEVVQIYYQAPQGKLGKPARALCAYDKTKLLELNESQTLTLSFKINDMASYDDSGATGNKSCYVLEEGNYEIYAGTDVRSASKIHTYRLDKLVVTEKLQEAMAPVEAFERIKPHTTEKGFEVDFEEVPLRSIDVKDRILKNMPESIEYTGDKSIKLIDVADGKNTLDEFIAQLSDENLAQLIRGEGMNCSKVTPGTGSGFGGLTPELMEFGIPACCTTDGPSGLRLDNGAKATSVPNGTLIACSFNRPLVEELFEKMAVEMYAYDIDALLGPGLNIHRNPLNGRNFEYFSEDPYLTGTMAASISKSISIYKGTATLKHFCCNNQEYRRQFVNAVVSERAIREIYLKAFEIAVKAGYTKAIMTSYNPVNGIWTAGNYDLNTTILRNEWNYKGIVMTDWWAKMNDEGEEGTMQNTRAMAIAQNDVYMCTTSALLNNNNDNTMESLEEGSLTRTQLHRNAKNILSFIMGSTTFEKYREKGCPKLKDNKVNLDDFECVLAIDDVENEQKYEMNIDESFYYVRCTYSIDEPKLNQYSLQGRIGEKVVFAFTLNGTDGEERSIYKPAKIIERYGKQFEIKQTGPIKVKKIEFFLTEND